MKIIHFVSAPRYLVLTPIIGLAIAAAAPFGVGGVGLIGLIIRSLANAGNASHIGVLPIFELLEFVHQFLIGTVQQVGAPGKTMDIGEVEVPVQVAAKNNNK